MKNISNFKITNNLETKTENARKLWKWGIWAPLPPHNIFRYFFRGDFRDQRIPTHINTPTPIYPM